MITVKEEGVFKDPIFSNMHIYYNILQPTICVYVYDTFCTVVVYIVSFGVLDPVGCTAGGVVVSII